MRFQLEIVLLDGAIRGTLHDEQSGRTGDFSDWLGLLGLLERALEDAPATQPGRGENPD
jgi:hypothetical protein